MTANDILWTANDLKWPRLFPGLRLEKVFFWVFYEFITWYTIGYKLSNAEI